MKLSTHANLLAIIDQSFDNKQGETVAYKEATIVVDGEVFKCSVPKDSDIQKQEGKGEATLDITTRDGKLKMRLVAFS